MLFLTAAAVALYARNLAVSPPFLHPDEAALSRQAESIAATGRDVDGHRFPLFFRLHDNVWTPPAPVYATALVLTAKRLSPASVRLPSVLVAALDLVLLSLVAFRVFGRTRDGLAAAGLLILAPAHFIHGRLAMASIYPVAFELGWLTALTAFIRRRELPMLVLSTLCLGIGFYTHPSAVLQMPAYLALTLVAVRDAPLSSSGRAQLLALAGFAIPLVALVPWFARYHDVFRFTLGDWGLHTLANPRDGLRYSVLNWNAVADRASIFWGFFSPSYLFVTGGDGLVGSTRHAGLFLGLMAIPFLVGAYDVVTARWGDPVWRLIAFAFALAPIGAVIFDESHAAGRELGVVPLGILIAVAGLERLAAAQNRAWRFAAIGVLVLMPIQFYGFYRDYFGAYPARYRVAIGLSE